MQFNEEFFKKEIRCGFEVSSMMKRAWAAELELLQILSEICDKYGLPYFADSGTMLGAVRHKGFIPWDDDIDIALKREDYIKLIEVLPKELPKGVVMAGLHSDSLEKRKRTNAHQILLAADRDLWDVNEYMRRFHGYPFHSVSIDVFPMDYIPYDEELYEVQRTLIQYALTILGDWERFEKDGSLADRIIKLEELTGVPIPMEDTKYHIWKTIDYISALYHKGEGNCLTFYAWLLDYKIKEEWYEKQVMFSFENTQIPLPNGWEEILPLKYGNYREFVTGGSYHDYPFYKEFQKVFEADLKRAGLSMSAEEFSDRVMRGELQVNWK